MTDKDNSLEPIGLKQSFWNRQFGRAQTEPQLAFDVIFGLLMPVLCFVLDPGIIRGSFMLGEGSLAKYGFLIYAISALVMFTFAFYLLFGARMKRMAAFIGGVFLAGAACSFLIGIIILPLSILGLFFIIGALGFTPFFTAFVYLRQAVRALAQGRLYAETPLLISALLLGVILVTVSPTAVNWGFSKIVSRSIDVIKQDDPGLRNEAVESLRRIKWYVKLDQTALDQIVFAYEREKDPVRKEYLSTAYKDIAGSDIGHRLAIFRD